MAPRFRPTSPPMFPLPLAEASETDRLTVPSFVPTSPPTPPGGGIPGTCRGDAPTVPSTATPEITPALRPATPPTEPGEGPNTDTFDSFTSFTVPCVPM